MKKMMALALAGASLVASAQASAALVLEVWGTATFNRADYLGSPIPINEMVHVPGSFYAKVAYSQVTPAPTNAGDVRVTGPSGPLVTVTTEFANGLNYARWWFATEGLDAVEGQVYKLTGASDIFFETIHNIQTGSRSQFTGQANETYVRYYDDPSYKIGYVMASVPEPSTWAMMIAGLSIVGAALRRRKIAISLA